MKSAFRALVLAMTLVLVLLLGLGRYYRTDLALRVASGIVAHKVCSKVFVSHLDPETVFEDTVERDGIGGLRRLLTFMLDDRAKTVDVSLFGAFGSHALFR